MADLTPDDVEDFTGGRLLAADPATGRLLSSRVAAARRYCGWPVTPVITETVTLDGPAGPVLCLATKNLITVSSLTECGTPHDVSQLEVSRSKGTVRHPYGCWTGRDGAIEITMTHGFTEEEAADWRLAVLASVDLADRVMSYGAFRAIGPFQYGASASFGQGSQFGEAELDVFDSYRIMLAP